MFGSLVISGILSPAPFTGGKPGGERRVWKAMNNSRNKDIMVRARIGLEKAIFGGRSGAIQSPKDDSHIEEGGRARVMAC